MEIVNRFSFHLVAADIGRNRKEIKKRAESNLAQSFSFDSILVIDDENLLISNKETEPFEVFSDAIWKTVSKVGVFISFCFFCDIGLYAIHFTS